MREKTNLYTINWRVLMKKIFKNLILAAQILLMTVSNMVFAAEYPKVSEYEKAYPISSLYSYNLNLENFDAVRSTMDTDHKKLGVDGQDYTAYYKNVFVDTVSGENVSIKLTLHKIGSNEYADAGATAVSQDLEPGFCYQSSDNDITLGAAGTDWNVTYEFFKDEEFTTPTEVYAIISMLDPDQANYYIPGLNTQKFYYKDTYARDNESQRLKNFYYVTPDGLMHVNKENKNYMSWPNFEWGVFALPVEGKSSYTYKINAKQDNIAFMHEIYKLMAPYHVEYYYETDGTYPQTPDYTSDKKAVNMYEATSVSISNEDKIPDASKPGYVLDESKSSEWQKTINTEGETVLKVYFKQQYTIKYNANGGTGTMADSQYEGSSATMPSADTWSFTRQDYEFAGFTIENGTELYNGSLDLKSQLLAEDDRTITLYAQWRENKTPETIIKIPLEKKWSKEPSDIDHVDFFIYDSEGGRKGISIEKDSDWKGEKEIPWNSNTNPTFTVVEYTDLDDYESNATADSPLPVASIKVTKPFDEPVDSEYGYVFDKTGIENAPIGNYFVNSANTTPLKDRIEIISADGYEFKDTPTYMHTANEGNMYGLVWTGDIPADTGTGYEGITLPGYNLIIKDYFVNKNGELFDLNINVPNVKLVSKMNLTDWPIIVFGIYDNKPSLLSMSGKALLNSRLALQQEVIIRVLNKERVACGGSLQFYFKDLDIANRYDNNSETNYSGLYSESVEPVDSINSRIYAQSDTKIQTDDNKRFYGSQKITDEEDKRTHLSFSGMAAGTRFIWRGSTCYTELDFAYSEAVNAYKNISNVVTNTLVFNKYQKVEITKNWENDVATSRPESITLHILGSDGSEITKTLTSAEGWSQTYYLPAYDASSNLITYSYYEEVPSGYQSSVPQSSPKALNTVLTYKPLTEAFDHDKGYQISKTGFDVVAAPDYELVPENIKSIAEIPDNVTLSNSNLSIATGTTKQASSQNPRTGIKYTGPVSQGLNNLGSATIRNEDVLRDAAGNLYDLVVTISNIQFYATSALSSQSVWLVTDALPSEITSQGKLYTINAFYEDVYRGNGPMPKLAMDFKLEVYDQEGNKAPGVIQYMFNDIDAPDRDTASYTYFDGPYAESFEPLTGVVSPIFMTSNSVLRIENNNWFIATTTTTSEAEMLTSAIVYSALASESSFRWTGVNCASSLFVNNYPRNTFGYANSLTNTRVMQKVKKILLIKNWTNDLEAYRPDSVTFVVNGSDGSSRNVEVTKDNNWQKTIYVPAYQENGTEISYTFQEQEIEGYESSSYTESSLSSTTTYMPNDDPYPIGTKLPVKKEGFNTVAVGDYKVVGSNLMSDAKNTITSTTPQIKYAQNMQTYQTGSSTPYAENADMIYFTGYLNKGLNNIDGQVTLNMEDYLENGAGEKFDLEITVSDIQIMFPTMFTEYSAGNYSLGLIRMNSEHITFDTRLMAPNMFTLAAKYKVTTRVLDKDGNEADGNLQLTFVDIDVADYTTNRDGTYNGPYSEAIQPYSGVTSSIFETSDTYIVEDGNRYRGSRATSSRPDQERAGITYTVKAGNASLYWTACADVGTVLGINSGLGSVNPAAYTNTATNRGNVTYKFVYKDITDEVVLEETEETIAAPNTLVTYAPEPRVDHYESLNYKEIYRNFETPIMLPSSGSVVYKIDFVHDTRPLYETDDVTRTINYVYEDGSKAADSVNQKTYFYREGSKDLVTDIDSWQDWTPENDTIAQVTSPTITGYLPDKANVSSLEVTKQSEDVVETVTYSPIKYKVLFDANEPAGSTVSGTTENMENLAYDSLYTLSPNGFEVEDHRWMSWNTQEDDKGTTFTDKQSFENLTSEDGKTITLYAQWSPVMKVKVIYRDVVNKQNPKVLYEEPEKSGLSGELVDYDPTERIQSLENLGYELFKNNYGTVQRFAISSTPKTDTYYIDLTHGHSIEGDSELTNNEVKRTIEYVKSDDDTKPFDDVEQMVLFQRICTKDNVTQDITCSSWEPDEATLNEVVSPELTGYTMDIEKVEGETINPESEDSRVVVTYSPIEYAIHFEPNWPEGEGIGQMEDMSELKFNKQYNLTENDFSLENYEWQSWNTKEDGTGTSHTDKDDVYNWTDKPETINLYAQWKPIMHIDVVYRDVTGDEPIILEKTDVYSGESGQEFEYEPKPIINKYEHLNYELKESPFDEKQYFPEGDLSQSKTIYVDFVQKTESLYEEVAVARLIRYQYSDGRIEKPFPDVNEKKIFSRTGFKNLVTGKDTWGPWTPEKDVLPQVVSKDLLRYMPDRKVVDARNITHETKSYEEVVTYSPMKYSVVYNPNGVKGTPYSQTPYYDAKEKFEKNKFESTCTFIEWNTDEKGKGKSYKPEEEYINLASGKDEEKVNLYAIWKCPEPEKDYKAPPTGD